MNRSKHGYHVRLCLWLSPGSAIVLPIYRVAVCARIAMYACSPAHARYLHQQLLQERERAQSLHLGPLGYCILKPVRMNAGTSRAGLQTSTISHTRQEDYMPILLGKVELL